jgi:hypothetical protein
MSELSPEIYSKVNFYAATAFVRKYRYKGRVSKGSHAHGKQRISLDDGWIIIEQEWYPNSTEKPEKLTPEEIQKWKKGRKS